MKNHHPCSFTNLSAMKIRLQQQDSASSEARSEGPTATIRRTSTRAKNKKTWYFDTHTYLYHIDVLHHDSRRVKILHPFTYLVIISMNHQEFHNVRLILCTHWTSSRISISTLSWGQAENILRVYAGTSGGRCTKGCCAIGVVRDAQFLEIFPHGILTFPHSLHN